MYRANNIESLRSVNSKILSRINKNLYSPLKSKAKWAAKKPILLDKYEELFAINNAFQRIVDSKSFKGELKQILYDREIIVNNKLQIRRYRSFTHLQIKILCFINHYLGEKYFSEKLNYKVYMGKCYTFNTYEEIANRLGCSKNTVKKAICDLTNMGIIEKGQFHLDQTNRTNFYTINYPVLFEQVSKEIDPDMMQKYSQILAEIYAKNEEKPESVYNPVDKRLSGTSHGITFIPSIILGNSLKKNYKKEFEKSLKQVEDRLNNKFGKEIVKRVNFFEKVLQYKRKTPRYMATRTDYRKLDKIEVDSRSLKIRTRSQENTTRCDKVIEKFHNEDHICSKFRYDIKNFFGEDVYLSWFNDIKLNFEAKAKTIEIICTGRAHKEYLTHRYLSALEQMFKHNGLIQNIVLKLPKLYLQNEKKLIRDKHKNESCFIVKLREFLVNELPSEQYNRLKNVTMRRSIRFNSTLVIDLKRKEDPELVDMLTKLKPKLLELLREHSIVSIVVKKLNKYNIFN